MFSIEILSFLPLISSILCITVLIFATISSYFPHRRQLKKQKKKDKKLVIDDISATSMPLLVKLYNTCARCFPTKKLTLAKLLKEAQRRAGLNDYGDEDKYPFREGLEKLLQDTNEPWNHLTAFGRLCIKEEFLRHATNLLRIQELIKKHPDVLNEEIRDPVFIIGPPRTATTHLHNTLSQHSAFRTPKYFEMLLPVKYNQKGNVNNQKNDINDDKLDPRYIKCQNYLRFFEYLRPYTNLMHDTGVEVAEEDVLLTSIAFRSYVFGVMFPCKEYMKWYGEADHTPAYEYLKLILQVMQWQDVKSGRQRKRWLIKSPEHLSSLPSLKRVFANATIVQTHRDMSEVLPSFLHFIWYINQIFCIKTDKKWMGEWWTAWFEFSLNRFTRDQEKFKNQVYNVKFEDYIKDNKNTVLNILEFLNETLKHEDKENIELYLEKNSRHSRGHIVYHSAMFGLKKQNIRERFKRYHMYFDLVNE